MTSKLRETLENTELSQWDDVPLYVKNVLKPEDIDAIIEAAKEEFTTFTYYGKEWRDVPNTDGRIKASRDGQILSICRAKPTIRRPNMYGKTGYGDVRIPIKVKDEVFEYRAITVHRLIAITFLPNPKGYSYVNHKDGDKSNNHVDNLEWCSPSENMLHASKMGLLYRSKPDIAYQDLMKGKLLDQAITKKDTPPKDSKPMYHPTN